MKKKYSVDKKQKENKKIKKQPNDQNKETLKNSEPPPVTYPDVDPGREFDAGEKEGDFPPDVNLESRC
ncbi:MAG: hypothetical protein A2622_00175 [Bdellovibrionales bacterium RIFCSPHIGHO2_01_FULL_40_29]|nr:MAG: hypothetical protein A2622_00175 [Bdellovibrionales bacterium RIFCSPHIGHO2_01_FULL_40_29]OFZ32543.1 MAG: hypothetical protein A3D17_04775 [Bdellovibrionales bacterium RIFCSPHIGHO2_02_FULL_40_15]